VSFEQRGYLQPGSSRAINQVTRDAKPSVLCMADGTEIRGTIYMVPGTRTLDMLNRQAEDFIAITNATIIVDGRAEATKFIAVNKGQIVSLREIPEEV
jgi:hypothetical protein